MSAVVQASFFPPSVISLDFSGSQKVEYRLCILTIELAYLSPLASCFAVLKCHTSFDNSFSF